VEVSAPALLGLYQNADAQQSDDSNDYALESETQSQRDINAKIGDTVIIAAVNGIKRLDGLGSLDGALPLNASINAVNPLGARGELVVGNNPMEQVVGDLNSGFKTPVNVGNAMDIGNAANTVAPMPAPGSETGAQASTDVDSQHFGVVASASPQIKSVSETLNISHEQPITLTAQLRLASLKAHRELEAIAEYMT